jgi:tight adherence protein B
MLTIAITFVVTFAAMLAVYWAVVLRPEAAEHDVLQKRLAGVPGPLASALKSRLVKDGERLSAIPAFDRVLRAANTVVAPLQQQITLSGLKLTPAAIFLACGCMAVVTFALVALTTRQRWLGLLLGLFAAYLPIAFVKAKARRRLFLLEEQFPEGVDLIARALRAGHAFTTGLSIVAEEAPEPMASEFRQLYEEQNFGKPMPEAMRMFAQRVPLLDARFFATAVLTQRESGGNLAGILDNISTVIRDRFKVKRQIRVVSAHARITGWILICEPPLLATVLTILMPGHMAKLVSDPIGVGMVIFAIVLQATGTLIIRKLVNIEY